MVRGHVFPESIWRCWKMPSEGPLRWSRHWSIWPMRKGCESWDYSPWRREGSGGSHHCVQIPDGKAWWGSEILRSRAHWQGKRQWAQVKMHKIPSEDKRFFYCEGGTTPAQAAQRGCRFSISGDTPKPNRTWIWATCSSWPCLSMGVGLSDLERSLQTSTDLWCWEQALLLHTNFQFDCRRCVQQKHSE